MELITDRASLPNVLDVTVDYCESQLRASEVALTEWELSVLAAAGTTVVAAAGDAGSSGCYPPTRTATVTYPASSRFVVSTGGVSYAGSAARPRQLRVWNAPGVAGGGGGTSRRVSAPPWQPGSMRTVPDVAADAQPGAVGEVPVCIDGSHCRWDVEGGTSVSATVLSAIAVMIASARHPSARWGNLAGRLWRRGARTGAVKDVTVGRNTTFTTACCKARKGYDLASGWGLFDPDELARSVFRGGKALRNPQEVPTALSSGRIARSPGERSVWR
jgi:subtilase family serine protease